MSSRSRTDSGPDTSWESGMTIYVTAHQDDWMLFRGDHAAVHLDDPAKGLLFIHTTAGDAGESNGWWEARELATVMAVRRQLGNPALTMTRPRIAGHGVQRYACGHAILYFLRCNDGGKQGEGFPLSGHRSISQLRDTGKTLKTADGSTRYRDWHDFCHTLAKIIERERCLLSPSKTAHQSLIHCGDYSPISNPGDHADHQATADAVRSFATSEGYARAWFLTYSSRRCDDNLPLMIANKKEQLFKAYGEELGRLMGKKSAFNLEEWNWWGRKSYARCLQSGQPDLDEPDEPVSNPAQET